MDFLYRLDIYAQSLNKSGIDLHMLSLVPKGLDGKFFELLL